MSPLFKVNLEAQHVERINRPAKFFIKEQTIRFFERLMILLSLLLLTSAAQAQCSMSCNNGLQVSISGYPDCNAMITPAMMLANLNACPGIKSVSITNELGQTLPQQTLADGTIISIVSTANIGQTLEVKVSHPASGNSCWGLITVEDKAAPLITHCEPVSIQCFQNTAPTTAGGSVPTPVAHDCSPLSSTYTDVFVEEACTTALSASINRHWTFTDTYGNTNTCVQVIDIERVTLADYTPVCPATYVLECDKANQPSVLPEHTGYPYIDIDGNSATTEDLLTLNNHFIGYCELGVSYSDEIIEDCGSSFKVIRNWTVFDWCAPTQAGVNPWTCIQIIKVEDTTEPVISPIADFSVGTSPNSCAAILSLPAIDVSDNCSDIVNVITITSIGTIYGNGGGVPYPGFGLGDHTIAYIATDECGNSSTFNLKLTVEDHTPPVVICDVVTTVSLQADGTAIIYAQTFDDGSYDNCGIADYQVRRMENTCSAETAFADYVSFSCCDIENGPVSVAMQVSDIHGNTNLCMVNVVVQDKTVPAISCPPNIELDCLDDWTDLELTGTAIAIEACGIDTLYHQDSGSVDECGNGTIQRIWTAADPYGNIASCVQWIHVENRNPFEENHITWPPNYDTNTCGNGLEPENLPAPYDGPIMVEGFCDLVAVTHEDTYLPITAPACYKILRRWTVVDWCLYHPNDANPQGYYEYNQIIKVVNSEAPEFSTACSPESFCSYEADCGATLVSLNVNGTDDCTPISQLNYQYEVDLDHDGTIDLTGNTNTFQNKVPLGTHWIKWYLEDGCGNVTTCDYEFVVADCKNPTPYCLNGIAIDLMANTGTIATWATDLDAGSYDNCGIAAYRIYSPSLGAGQLTPPVGSTNSIVFDCEDIGTQSVDFWVMDIHGNWAYCSTYIVVQDNNQVCGGVEEVAISGTITNEQGIGLGVTSLHITGSESMTIETAIDGSFTAPSLAVDGNYTLRPEKDINYLNGVSTFDLVMMTRHILGIQPFDSPYKMIAADVNKSGSVTTFDIVHLRKLILQLTDNFPGNQSWRFIDADFVFPNDNNPFLTSFPETAVFNGLMADDFADFVGIKVGDVNGNANPGNLEEVSEARSLKTMSLKAADKSFVKGEILEVDIRVEDFERVNGFQLVLAFDADKISFLDLNSHALASFQEDNYSLQLEEHGKLVISWHQGQPISLETGTVLFNLQFIAEEAGKLSKTLNIDTTILASEVYQENLQKNVKVLQLDLEYTLKNSNFESLTNGALSLKQNTPNPFRLQTQIPFYLPSAAQVSLRVFDPSGRQVWSQEARFDEGNHNIVLQASALKVSGLLYYTIETGDFKETRKMIIIE